MAAYFSLFITVLDRLLKLLGWKIHKLRTRSAIVELLLAKIRPCPSGDRYRD